MYYGFKSPCICFVKEDYWLIIDEEKAPNLWVPFSLCIYHIIAKTSHFQFQRLACVELVILFLYTILVIINTTFHNQ